MTIFEILQTLHSQNIQVIVSGDKLQIDAPKGSLTPEIATLLKDKKLELIKYLADSKSKTIDIKPIDRNNEIALSFAQQRLWFIDQVDGGSAHYNTPGVIDVSGNFKIEIAEAAFKQIIQRHEPLRTNFKASDNGAIQIIHEQFEFKITQVDLSQLSGERQNKFVETAIKQDVELAFNLNEDLMLRVSYFKLHSDQGVMLFNMHHIASDGWSISILVNEFLSFYRSELEGTQNPFPPLEIQYADYAHWQRQWLKGEILESQLNYWSKQLEGLPQVHSLPLDFERPKYQTFNGGQYSFSLNINTLKKLTTIAVEQQSTLFMLLHAAFSLVLSRYSNSADIVIATPVANRLHKELESLIGFFVNTLVLRSDCSGDSSFVDFLTQIKRINFEAQNNQDVPFEYLVDKVNPKRSTSFNTLFQVMLSMETNESFKLELPDVSLTPRKNKQVKTKFEIELNAVPVYAESHGSTEPGLHCFVEFNTDLFKPQTIKRLADSLQVILESIAANPNQLLSDLPLLSQKESVYLLHGLNGKKNEQPSDLCLHQLFEQQVKKTPNHTALVFKDKFLSYLQLNERANQLAHYLIEQGVKTEDLIGICVERSIEMIVGILATLKAGAAYLPLDPNHPKGRLEHMMQDGGLSMVLTQTHLLQKTKSPNIQQLALDDTDWLDQLNSFSIEDPEAGDLSSSHLAYVIYTSGSTGKPKGVMIEHNSISNHILNVIKQLGFSEEERFLQFSSMSFDTFIEQTFASLTLGTRLYMRGETLWSAEDFYQYCNSNQITVTDLAPVYLSALLTNKESNKFWLNTSLKKMVVGGERVPRALIEQWIKLTSETACELFNAYGPTEATITSHHKCIVKDEKFAHASVSIGQVLPGRKAYILDQQKNLTPDHSIGELYIGGMGLARGYLNQPELTNDKFIEHTFSDGHTERLYRTGDLVRYLPDSCGEMEFIDRIDDQVKLRGYRIELGEIEYYMTQQEVINSSVVIVREDIPGQKRIVGYYVSESRSDEEQLSAIIKANLVENLPTYMVPSFFVRIATIPLTANGKIDRKALPLPSSGTSQAGKHQVPKNETEQKLGQIWADLLNIPLEKLSTDDNFFSLGGDSILSIQVASRALALDLKVTIKQIFEFQTIASLAPHVVSSQIDAFQGAETGVMPLLPIQHNFFSDGTDLHHYNQSVILKVPNDFTAQLMKHFIQLLFIRHDALRLRFVFNDNQWQAIFEEFTTEMLSSSLEVITLKEAGFAALEEQANIFQSSLSLAVGPMFKAIHCTDANGDIRFLMIMHHLMVDGVSWRILFEDLELLYKRYGKSETLALASKTTSYKAWGKFLQEYSQSDSLHKELSFWQNVLSTPTSVFSNSSQKCLTHKCERNDNNNKQLTGFKEVKFNLNQKATSQLLTVAQQAYKTQINELLLSSLLLGINQWSGDQCIRIDLEGHGREELSPYLNLNQTVGWFTTIFPLILNSDSMDIESVICAVKEQCRAVPNHGIGFGILKYLNKAEGIAVSDNASILFNYLGQFSNQESGSHSFSFSDESTGENISPLRHPEHGMNFNGSVVEGRLFFVLDYDQSIYHESAMEQLLTAIKNAMVDVIAHCENPNNGCLTPADFPLSEVSQVELNKWQEAYQIEDIYPATAMQQGLIFHSALDKSAYLTQLMFTLEPGADLDTFRLSWQNLLGRHGILRTVFVTTESGEMQQLVLKEVELPWTESNLASLDETEQLQQIESDRELDKAAGFDLEHGPLIRLKIWHLGQQRYRVLLSDHHALTDGWSMPLIFAEVMQFYRAELTGINAKIEAAIPYRNYVQWLSEQHTDEAVNFWQAELSGIEHPSLIAESMQNSGNDNHPITCDLSLNQKTSDQLVDLARELQVTINSLLQAAWAYLLHRYCDQSTVVFATTVSGRPEHLSGVEKMIGLFINTIPVRIDIPEKQHFTDWVKILHAKQTERNQYSYLPLVEIQQLAELNSSELMDNLFVFENYPFDEKAINSTDNHRLEVSNHTMYEETNYSLTASASLLDTITVNFVAKPNHFNKRTLSNLAKHFETILCSIAKSPAQFVENIDLLTDEETHDLLHVMNDTRAVPPNDLCIHQLFEQQVESTPNHVAVSYQDQSLTYTELNVRANQLAHYISAQGVCSDQLIGVCLERSLDMMVAILAVLKAGAAYVPLDPANPQARLKYIIEDSDIAILVTQEKLKPKSVNKSLTVLTLDDKSDANLIKSHSINNPKVATLCSRDLAYVIYTSGTTGKPKGVMVEHQSVTQHLNTIINEMAFNSSDRFLQFLSMSFDAFVEQSLGSLIVGASLHIRDESLWSVEQFYAYTQKHHITVTDIPPVYLAELLATDQAAKNYWATTSLTRVVVGGEALPKGLVERWFDLNKVGACQLYNAYGPTETTITSHLIKIINDDSEVAIGAALPGRTSYILDQFQRLTPDQQIGELYIGGAGLARGYLKQTALTNKQFINHVFSDGRTERLYRTGDLVRHLGQGKLTFVGRVDHQIKIRGFRVELSEIEHQLSAYPGIKTCVVVIHQTPANQKSLCAYYECSIKSDNIISVEQIKQYLAANLPQYMMPSVFVELDSMPINVNGKIDRHSLPAPDEGGLTAQLVPPEEGIEKELAIVWAEVLNLPEHQIGAHSNFFELGGHSLHAVKLLTNIKNTFTVNLKMNALFELTTLSTLAKHLAMLTDNDCAAEDQSGLEHFEL